MSANPIAHEMTLGMRLTEARSNIQYWKCQQALRTHPDGKIKAGARIIVWQSTAAAIEAEIALLKLSPSTH